MKLYNGDCLEVMKNIPDDSVSSNPGDVVLDCFMGSGSTGVACIHEGREFIGIEKDAEYFRIAKMRLEQEQETGQQLSLL